MRKSTSDIEHKTMQMVYNPTLVYIRLRHTYPTAITFDVSSTAIVEDLKYLQLRGIIRILLRHTLWISGHMHDPVIYWVPKHIITDLSHVECISDSSVHIRTGGPHGVSVVLSHQLYDSILSDSEESLRLYNQRSIGWT